MRILVVCCVLSTLGLTFASPLYSPVRNSLTPKEINEVRALIPTHWDTLNSQQADDSNNGDDDEDMANLEGVFKVMEQVDIAKAKAAKGDHASAQIFKTIVKGLWNLGKRYLKRRYCTEEQETKALLQELIGEQAIAEVDNADTGEEEAIAELQSLFATLKKVKAKVMQSDMSPENTAEAQRRWWRRVKRWFGRKVRGFTRKYVC